MSKQEYQKMEEMLNNLKNKPSLLLHVCCGPCSTHVLKLLAKFFDITIFYTNDNTYPYDEYMKRYANVIKAIMGLGLDIKVLIDEYDHKRFLQCVSGLENLGEKSIRCYECYKMRLTRTVLKAQELHFDYFTTTLSISPHKRSDWINEIGNDLAACYNVSFLYSNFKKDGGYLDSIRLANELDLYRQDYCGCEFSLRGDIK